MAAAARGLSSLGPAVRGVWVGSGLARVLKCGRSRDGVSLLFIIAVVCPVEEIFLKGRWQLAKRWNCVAKVPHKVKG